MNTADIQLPNTDSVTGEPQEQTVIQLFFVISMYWSLLSIIQFIRQCQKCSKSNDGCMHDGWDCSYLKLIIYTIHKGMHPTVTITLLPTKNTVWNNGAVSKMSGHFESMPKDYQGCNGNELLSQTDRKLEKTSQGNPNHLNHPQYKKNDYSRCDFSSNMQEHTIWILFLSYSSIAGCTGWAFAQTAVTRFKSTLVQKHWHRNRKGMILKAWGYTQHILSLNFNNS